MRPSIPYERFGRAVACSRFAFEAARTDFGFSAFFESSLALMRVTFVFSSLTWLSPKLKVCLLADCQYHDSAHRGERQWYNTKVLIYGLLLLATIAASGLLLRTIWALNRFAYRPLEHLPINDGDIPSVSICIAARNETHALAQCLERVLKSDYPKLEVLVLDDSSNDDTSLIIKSFAGAGVRFIAGAPLPNEWLGKNHAYQTLIDEASGDYVLFLDVDTAIQPGTVTKLVRQLIANNRSMLSVLPRREDSYHASALFGTMRYQWELLLASRKSPPASSALWMVERRKLDELGVGLKNYGRSVRPERHLARQLQRQRSYWYLIGTKELGVAIEKRLQSQRETAVRLYYPASGRRFVLWALTLAFFFLLDTPIVVIFSGAWNQHTFMWSVAIIALTYSGFILYTLKTYGGATRLLRVLIWPMLIIQEIILLIMSFITYRFGTVTWKGRPVNAQPVNHDALRVNE
jgi:glycosyltransferase involved in cell wall biosynthesis